MYLYIFFGFITIVAVGVILVVALTMENDDKHYRRHRTYSEYFDDEV